jgi:hypothetical protein
MATVPNGTRFIGIATSVDLTERKSALLNKQTEPFTIEDIASTVGVGATGPQGVQGPAGPLGPVGPAGLEWQGAWVSGTSYVADDAVGYNGASWFCILATSGTTTPNLDGTHWALLASQGAQGEQGVQGPTGPQGLGATQTLQQTVDLGNTVTGGSSIVIQNGSNGSDLSGGDLNVYNSLDITDVYPGNITFTKQTGIGVIELKVPSTVLAPRVITLPDADGTIALTSDINNTKTTGILYGPETTNAYTTLIYDINLIAEGVGNKFKLPATTSVNIGKEIIVNVLGNSCVVYPNNLASGIEISISSYTNQKIVVYNDLIKFVCTGANVWQMQFIPRLYPTLNGKNLVNYTGPVYTYTINTTTSPLSLATLNSTYTNETKILEYKVYCPNISGGGLVYIKTGTATWVSSSITAVV